jgi:hypothetical protein
MVVVIFLYPFLLVAVFKTLPALLPNRYKPESNRLESIILFWEERRIFVGIWGSGVRCQENDDAQTSKVERD